MNLRTDFTLKTRLVYRRSLFHGSSLTTDFAENEFNSLPWCSSSDINLAYCNLQSKSFAVKIISRYEPSFICRYFDIVASSKLFLTIRYSNKFVFPLLCYLCENSLDLRFDQVERLSLFLREYYTKRNGIRIK